MSELKSCPFCGCEPLLFSTHDGLSGNGKVTIAACATMSEGFILPMYLVRGSSSLDSEEKVTQQLIAKWNKRTPPKENE